GRLRPESVPAPISRRRFRHGRTASRLNLLFSPVAIRNVWFLTQALLLLFIPALKAPAAVLTISVASPEPPLRFGAEDLSAALRAGGDLPRIVSGRSGSIRVGHLGTAEGRRLAGAARLSVSTCPEAVSL